MNTNNLKNIKLSPVNMEARKKLNFKAGDTVRVWSKITDEKGKERLQAFEGVVLARKHGTEPGARFTVRKVASRVGVERIFPLYSPNIEKVEIVKKSKARRSKLYYIRNKAAKEVKRKLRSFMNFDQEYLGNEEEEEVVEEVKESEVAVEEGAIDTPKEETSTEENKEVKPEETKEETKEETELKDKKEETEQKPAE